MDITGFGEIIEKDKNKIKLHLEEGKTSSDLLLHLLNNGNQVTAFREILPTLNEVFIKQVNTKN